MANKILPVAEALKQVYTALGGNDDEVLDMSTNTELIQEIAGVATGGGGLPEVSDADEGKVLTVDSSGEWAAEMLPTNMPTVGIKMLDSEGNAIVIGDFNVCLNCLKNGYPVAAFVFSNYYSNIQYFEIIEILIYDPEHPDQITFERSSHLMGWIWTAEGITVYYND